MHEERLAVVKKEIRSVIITYPRGVSLNGFLKTYHQLVGIRLPTREFGFTSDIDFLLSLPDVVKIQTDRNGDFLLNCIVDKNTEHIQKLVSKQRVVKTKTKDALDRGGYREKVPNHHPTKIKPFVSAALRKNLFEILKEFPDGISYNSLELAYKKKFKRPLILDFLSESRHNRLRKLEMAVSELHVKVVDETERLFYRPLIRKCTTLKQEGNAKISTPSSAIQDSSSQKIQASIENFEAADIPIIPRVVKEDFEKVLKLYPDGVFARHFPFLYERMSGEMFDLADLGFNNFLELADALPDVFICVKPYKCPNEWMIFHTCFSESAEKLKKLNETLELSDERFGKRNEAHNQAIPSDIVSPTHPFKPAEFPSDINLSLYIPVFISAAANPGCFWFKLQIEEVICRFKELEDEMQSFYHNVQSDIYQISPKDIKIGSNCVAIHENHWYRITITSSPNDADLLNVYLVDYGSWEKVHCSKLRYMKDPFISLPAQAFKAQLASIKPLNNAKAWSKKATARFLQLCIKTYIMALVDLEFDESLSVFLCDTSGDDDVFINETLVDENLAESYSTYNNLVEESPVKVSRTHYGKTAMNGASIDDCANYCTHSERFKVNEGCTSDDSTLVKRVYLGDDYWTNIIIISNMAYLSATDLCSLFWHDKSAEVLKSRLQCKNLEISTTTILRSEHKDLFLKCENNELRFSPHQQSVELYPLSSVMKILNCLGQPSAKVRETIHALLKDPNSMNTLIRNSSNSDNATVSEASLEDGINKLCLYDLKAMHEAIKFKRLLLQKKSQDLHQTEIKKDLIKIETQLETIQKQIKNINSICLSYTKYE